MEKLKGGLAVAGFAHGKSCGPEMLGDKLANARFVVGDEDEGLGHKCLANLRRCKKAVRQPARSVVKARVAAVEA
ncbi:hypothetical protein SUTMEG_16300 [Sutterella megalosphaeroides]|uniref:Uncharacterized protein n=1 Tax=Sutterella megalosphaeroides TaxID=2494234 RepID=A0A2Z6IB90_9BURK|nr:hypothetical protein SUTMEG_16300 [Sutterella megalosphaeroides]